MSDGGLCLGRKCTRRSQNNLRIKPTLNWIWDLNPIQQSINNFKGLKSKIIIKNLEDEIFSQLKKSKVIGIVRGRMEFGPRALCKRSISCSKTSDNTINDWLNKECPGLSLCCTNCQRRNWQKSFSRL